MNTKISQAFYDQKGLKNQKKTTVKYFEEKSFWINLKNQIFIRFKAENSLKQFLGWFLGPRLIDSKTTTLNFLVININFNFKRLFLRYTFPKFHCFNLDQIEFGKPISFC